MPARLPTLPLPLAARLAALAAALLLGACATPPPPARPAAPSAPPQAAIDAKRRADFDRGLDVWHGASTKELAAKLGAPSAVQREANGRSVHVYTRNGKVSGPTGPVDFSCVVRYTVVADRVIGHSIEGC